MKRIEDWTDDLARLMALGGIRCKELQDSFCDRTFTCADGSVFVDGQVWTTCKNCNIEEVK